MTGRRAVLAGAAAVAAVLATAGLVWWRPDRDESLSAPDAEAVVRDYLAAVERQDYAAAARFLADPATDDRPDLDPLAIDDPTEDEIAAGLAEYCRAGCIAPTGMSSEAGDDGYLVIVTFGEPRGHPLQRSFTVAPDGKVRGLPPAGTGTIPQA